MTLETKNDLERKTEEAVATYLRKNPALKRIRMRHNAEESVKVNQDLVLVAKRGVQNPQFSGIFEIELTLTLTVRYRRTVDTLPNFLALLKAIEDSLTVTGVESAVFGTLNYVLASQISLCAENFHCYEMAVSAKDDSPQDNKHSCIWTLTGIVMQQNYSTASQLQSS